jgi:hypothetical protein
MLHFPYFDLYRKQVVKQADLVLAMHLAGGTAEEDAGTRFRAAPPRPRWVQFLVTQLWFRTTLARPGRVRRWKKEVRSRSGRLANSSWWCLA